MAGESQRAPSGAAPPGGRRGRGGALVHRRVEELEKRGSQGMCPSPLGVDRNCASRRNPLGWAAMHVGFGHRTGNARRARHVCKDMSAPFTIRPIEPDDKAGSRRSSPASARSRGAGASSAQAEAERPRAGLPDRGRPVPPRRARRGRQRRRDRRRRPLRDLGGVARPRGDGLRGRRQVAGAGLGTGLGDRSSPARGRAGWHAHRLDVRVQRARQGAAQAPRLPAQGDLLGHRRLRAHPPGALPAAA